MFTSLGLWDLFIYLIIFLVSFRFVFHLLSVVEHTKSPLRLYVYVLYVRRYLRGARCPRMTVDKLPRTERARPRVSMHRPACAYLYYNRTCIYTSRSLYYYLQFTCTYTHRRRPDRCALHILVLVVRTWQQSKPKKPSFTDRFSLFIYLFICYTPRSIIAPTTRRHSVCYVLMNYFACYLYVYIGTICWW